MMLDNRPGHVSLWEAKPNVLTGFYVVGFGIFLLVFSPLMAKEMGWGWTLVHLDGGMIAFACFMRWVWSHKYTRAPTLIKGILIIGLLIWAVYSLASDPMHTGRTMLHNAGIVK